MSFSIIAKNTKTRIAVIGAGISNISFLYSFKPTDNISISIFEKSNDISGRMKSVTNQNFTYDIGANYFTAEDERVYDIIHNKLPSKDLIEINNYIFSFDMDNNININKTEASKHNIIKKYNYKSGIDNLSRLLYQNIQLIEEYKIFFNTEVTSLLEKQDSWEVYSKENQSLGEYDYIVFGIPTPEAYRIIKESKFKFGDDYSYKEIIEDLSKYKYKMIYSLAIAYQVDTVFGFYALINSDRKHPISWISIENEKEERVKEKGVVLFIVQMSDEFTVKHCGLGSNSDIVIKEISDCTLRLLPDLSNGKIVYTNLKLWENALPNLKLDDNIVDYFAGKNIRIIGDSLLGRGRVEHSILTGISLYDKINS